MIAVDKGAGAEPARGARPGWIETKIAADAERDERLRTKRVRLAMLPPALHPRIVESAMPLTDCSDPDFHYQLGMFIAGVETIAARQAASPGATADSRT